MLPIATIPGLDCAGHPKATKSGATKPTTPFAPKQTNTSYETQILLDIKSEIGQYRKETRELKENVNKLIATSNGKGGKGGWGKKNWDKNQGKGQDGAVAHNDKKRQFAGVAEPKSKKQKIANLAKRTKGSD